MKNNLVSRTINCIVKYFKITKKGKNEKAEEGKRQLKRMWIVKSNHGGSHCYRTADGAMLPVRFLVSAVIRDSRLNKRVAGNSKLCKMV